MTTLADPRTVTGFISGDRQRPTAEVEERAARAATVFAGMGVGPGDRVALMLRNDLAFMEASYAASALGAIAVPVNWHYKGDEVAYILSDSAAKVLVVHADLLPQIDGAVPAGVPVLVVDTPPEIAAAYGIAEGGGVPSWDAVLAGAEPRREEPLPSPAAMIYTSGTTGRPKGVRRLSALNREDPNVLAGFVAIGLRPGMRTVISGPMYHTAPNVFALTAGRFGGLVVLQPRFDAEELLAMIERYAITSLHMVPTMFVRLLRLPEAVKRKYDLSSLQNATHAAAPCPQDVKRAMIDWWGPIISEYYGGTETGAVVACNSEEWLAHPGTVGKPLPGCVVKVFRTDGSEADTGEPGDVYVASEGFGDFTYHGRDEARQEIEHDGLVTVGDIGYLDEDGFLHLADRRKDMIISGGVNIYPAEIEAVLIGAPGVADCAVFGIPHDEMGEQVAAAIQPVPDAEPDPDALKAFLREQLAGFKVPRHFEFHAELPREDSGKIFKRKLRAAHWPEGRAL